MSQPTCVLCDKPAADDYRAMGMTPDAAALWREKFPGTDPDEAMRANVLCGRCAQLSPKKLRKLARKAMDRELAAMTRDILKG